MERHLVRIALFAALIAALGVIPKIDTGFGVPITAQSLGIMLCGTVLGARHGALAVLLFLALTAMGLPLLAGGRGGLALFVSPTLGFLVGFPIAAFVTGWLMSLTKDLSAVATFNAAVLGGIVVLYGIAIPIFAQISDKTAAETFWLFLAFVPGDVIKAGIAAVVTMAIARARPGLVQA